MFISVTRLRIRSIRFLLSFLWRNEKTVAQILRAPGFLEGMLFVDARRAFWTITTWQDKASAMAYRNTGEHKAAMPKLMHWCDEASVVHWETAEASSLPLPPEAHARMIAEGRRSKVRHPAHAHESWSIAPPRWPSKMMRPLRAKQRHT
jgi:hypothetical protein